MYVFIFNLKQNQVSNCVIQNSCKIYQHIQFDVVSKFAMQILKLTKYFSIHRLIFIRISYKIIKISKFPKKKHNAKILRHTNRILL